MNTKTYFKDKKLFSYNIFAGSFTPPREKTEILTYLTSYSIWQIYRGVTVGISYPHLKITCSSTLPLLIAFKGKC